MIRFKNFIIQLFKNIKKGIVLIWKKIKHTFTAGSLEVWNKKIRFMGIIIICSLIFYFFSLKATALWFLFLMFLAYKWDSRIIAVLALISLVICPFLLIADKETVAEKIAIYAYYFLVMTVILQIMELVREKKLKN